MASGDIHDLRNEPTPRFQVEETRAPRLREEHVSSEVMTGGSMGEAVGGIATVILAIVGLAHVLPVYLAAIAAIVFGAALLAHGGSVAMRFSRLLAETAGSNLTPQGGGMSAEFLGGAAGIVLGILSLLNIAPEVLLPVAVIVFGATIIMSCGTTARLNSLVLGGSMAGNEVARRMAGDLVWASSGAQALVGLAAVILGILGVVGIYAFVLTLVAFLCLGAVITLSGSALSSKMTTMLNR